MERSEDMMHITCMNRSEALLLLITGCIFFFSGGLMNADEPVQTVSAVDHLLLGAADLDQGIQWIEERTGIKAVIGGVHPGMGTRNALLSLGGKRYLEIIAPDPAQDAYNFAVDVRKLQQPKLITWAATSAEIDALAKTASAEGYQVFGPQGGSRNKPDGTVLRWKVLFLQTDFMQGDVIPFPFFIQWASDSVHPSQDSPKGCELESLVLEHPRSNELKAALEKLGIDAQVRETETARLIATIQTPKGKLVLK